MARAGCQSDSVGDCDGADEEGEKKEEEESWEVAVDDSVDRRIRAGTRGKDIIDSERQTG